MIKSVYKSKCGYYNIIETIDGHIHLYRRIVTSAKEDQLTDIEMIINHLFDYYLMMTYSPLQEVKDTQ